MCDFISQCAYVKKKLCLRSFATGKTKNRASLMQCGEPHNLFPKESLVLLDKCKHLEPFYADLLEKRIASLAKCTKFSC